MTPDSSAAAIVIPARYASTRFPGKPLHNIAGRSMLERVWRIARAVRGCSRVVIATDDARIAAHAASFGAESVMTPAACANGTERVQAAVRAAGIAEDIVLNLQGDALLTPPWVLEAMLDAMRAAPDADIVTPAVRLDGAALDAFRAHKAVSPASGCTVVFDTQHNALYFSKSVIPFLRNPDAAAIYRHIGLYGYRRRGLDRYVTLTPTPLETAEGLEQLRALEHGMKIRIAIVDYRGRTHGSVDAPEDVPIIESIIAREGELV
ncbi:MAG: 3-deoxy-manno-octulosonate cytidylyltransferase [Alphaproteobacteria bacterium]|nr:3-deoxy-manno-octulosonate cytidylyltransferase [Alphaproteobacteria bacterium]